MRDRDGQAAGGTSRRQLLRSGVGLALVLAASGVAIGRTRGYAAPAGRTLLWTSPWQWTVVQHAARRIAAPDGGGAGGGSPVPTADDVDARLPPGAQDRVLASLEASSHDLLRAGFAGLKALVYIGYYRDVRTWGIVGYDGPLVGRPEGGWR